MERENSSPEVQSSLAIHNGFSISYLAVCQDTGRGQRCGISETTGSYPEPLVRKFLRDARVLDTDGYS